MTIHICSRIKCICGCEYCPLCFDGCPQCGRGKIEITTTTTTDFEAKKGYFNSDNNPPR